jgi:hypothetical protein
VQLENETNIAGILRNSKRWKHSCLEAQVAKPQN